MEDEQRSVIRRWVAAGVFGLALLALLLWQLGGPEAQWDEGWTLSVARSWAERGVYGRLRDGLPIGPGLSASFWVVWPTSWGLRLFGTGFWQGRLFVALCAVAAIGALGWLAAQLYGRRVGWGAAITSLLLAGHPQLNPLIMGRQVYAEMPQLLLLLGGLCLLLLALRGSALWLIPAVPLMSLALIIKAQTAPFWLVGMLAGLTALLLLRRWRSATVLGAALAGGWLAQPLLFALQDAILAGRVPAGEPVTGLLSVVAVVPSLFNRQFALSIVLIFGLLTVLGLLDAARSLWRERQLVPRERAAEAAYAIRTVLWAMLVSWFGWYLLLSVGVPRYLFPVSFLGAIFTAAWLERYTGGYQLSVVLERALGLVRRGGGRLAGLGALAFLLLVTFSFGATALGLSRYYPGADNAAPEAAAFLNAQTPPGARIETYESELHFLLERPYHYPPDQLHVTLNRRSLLNEEIAIDYDALESDPDYLVVGRFARENELYAPWIARGVFRLDREIGEYAVYRRVRG